MRTAKALVALSFSIFTTCLVGNSFASEDYSQHIYDGRDKTWGKIITTQKQYDDFVNSRESTQAFQDALGGWWIIDMETGEKWALVPESPRTNNKSVSSPTRERALKSVENIDQNRVPERTRLTREQEEVLYFSIYFLIALIISISLIIVEIRNKDKSEEEDKIYEEKRQNTRHVYHFLGTISTSGIWGIAWLLLYRIHQNQNKSRQKRPYYIRDFLIDPKTFEILNAKDLGFLDKITKEVFVYGFTKWKPFFLKDSGKITDKDGRVFDFYPTEKIRLVKSQIEKAKEELIEEERIKLIEELKQTMRSDPTTYQQIKNSIVSNNEDEEF